MIVQELRGSGTNRYNKRVFQPFYDSPPPPKKKVQNLIEYKFPQGAQDFSLKQQKELFGHEMNYSVLFPNGF